MSNRYLPSENIRSVAEAVEVARQYQKEGAFDLFRGQTSDWPVQASLFREATDQQFARRDLERFVAWVHASPELRSLHHDEDAILAVAQHYNIATPFLDWTTSPDIAGFFASDASSRTPGDRGVILCIRTELLIETWEAANEHAREHYGHDIVRIVDIRVADLWRLQSQKGRFLDLRVGPGEFEMLGDIHRIYFPNTELYDGISPDTVRPKEKSHIEILLDQYFQIRGVDEGYLTLRALHGGVTWGIPSSEGIPTYFIGDALPPIHPSWNDPGVASWHVEPDEAFRFEQSSETLRLRADATESVAQQVQSLLNARNVRRPTARWIVLDVDPPLASDDALSMIWDGMRRLPYTDEQIAAAFENYLQPPKGSTIGAEFEATANRVRVDLPSRSLMSCVRSDLLDFVKSEYRAQIERWFPDDARSLLTILRSPARLFEFQTFADFFARELIPAQFRYRSFNRGPLFNPSTVSVIGNS